MKLENQLTSLELSKKLRELGVPQNSLFYWSGYDEEREADYKSYCKENGVRYEGLKPYELMQGSSKAFDCISAFTVAELGEMLPRDIKVNWRSGANNGGTTVLYFYASENYDCEANTEADARAKMLVYLIENKLIRSNQLKI